MAAVDLDQHITPRFDDQEWLDALDQALPVGLFLLDPEGILLYGNRSLARLLKWDGPMIGIPVTEFMPPSCQTVLASGEWERLREGNEVFQRQLELVDAWGNPVHAQVTAIPYPTPQGIRLLVGIVKDVTEEERLRLKKQAADRVVLHDLKNPLSGFLGLAQLMRREFPDSDRVRHFSERLMVEGLRLLRLMETQLALGRLEDGPFTYNPEPLSWSEAVAHALEDWVPPELRAARAFHGEGLYQEQDFFTHPALVKIALGQVLRNAFQHSPAGSPVFLHLDYITPEATASIRVTNEGSIADKDLPAGGWPIRGDTRRLGLFLAGQVCRALGGSLVLTSQANPVVFELRLPNRQPEGALW